MKLISFEKKIIKNKKWMQIEREREREREKVGCCVGFKFRI